MSSRYHHGNSSRANRSEHRSSRHVGSSSTHPPTSNREGSRSVAGGPSRRTDVTFQNIEEEVAHPDTNTTMEQLQNILEPHNPEEQYMNSATSPGISEDRDRTIMKFAAKPRTGIHVGTMYVWDARAERIRLGDEAPSTTNPQYQLLHGEFPASCGICGESSHRANVCPLREFGWVLRIRRCKYCGCVILGAEVEGTCCGNKNARKVGLSFMRGHSNRHLEELYRLRSFQSLSTHLNLLFATVVTFMDMKYVRGGGPSFLRLQGNVSISVPGKEVQYTYLWSDGPPSLNANDYSASFARRITSNRNVRYLVPHLYELLLPRPEIARYRYRNLFNSAGSSSRSQEGERTVVEITENAAEDGTVVHNFQGTHEARIEVSTAGGPLPEDRRGRPLAMRAFVVEPTGLFRSQAPVARLLGGRETHLASRRNQNRVIKYKHLKPDSLEAEKGAFPLLYPYGDIHVPYDSATYIENRDASSSRGNASGIENVKLLTWAEHSKRRLYTDNILLNSGTLLQQWLLRTNTNIEDLRLRYLEKEQMRMVEEQELRNGTHTGTDDIGPPGKLFLPGNFKNSPAYWRQKRLDVQAMVARLGSPTFFITITMNVWREEMKRLGLDIENRSSFSPQGDRLRPFDRPDLVARVYNQYANAIMKDLQNNSERLFGLKCIGIAAKLEFQERNTPHHHILLWLEGGVIADPDIIDSLVRAELPRGNSTRERELRDLVKRFNIHRHSPYCRGRSTNGLCRFGYDRTEVTPETTIDEFTNRVTYRRREEEDLKVVPYNPDLTLKYKAHINVERTQGGGAVAYLMKYAFKSAKEQDVVVLSRNEDGREDELQNEIRAYMRARVVGSVEAAWNLFEFRHVRIHPSVQALDIHLEGQRQVLVRNVRLPRSLKSSMLERYFKRPSRYHDLDYMTYYESVRLYKTLPRSISPSEVTRDDGTPRMFVVKRSTEDMAVSRIRYASPANTELFALRILLMNGSFNSFEDPKRVGDETFSTYRDAAISKGLYIHRNEYETAFDEAVRHHSTPSELRNMIVTSYQQGVNPRSLIEKHERALTADIPGDRSSQKRRELLRRIIFISDSHGGRLIRRDPFFEQVQHTLNIRESEVDRAREGVQRRRNASSRSRRSLQERYENLNRGQKSVFDEIMQEVLERTRMTEPQRCNTHGRVFFLQGRAGTGKTYLLSLLRDIAESKGVLVQMTATTGIAAALYQDGRTLHSLLGLGVDDNKDSQSRERRTLSKYGPRSQRAELLRMISLLVIDEASMCPKVLFEIVDTVLKDLRRSNKDFAGMVIVMAGDYMQLLPVVPRTRTRIETDGTRREVPVSLLKELPWYSCELWDRRVKVLRITEQVRQQDDRRFAETLLQLGRGTFPTNRKLPLLSTSNVGRAYKSLWKWVDTQDKRDVRLDRLMVAPTNQLVDMHNENALGLFPGRRHVLRSATTVVPIRRPDGRTEQPQNLIGPELTYNYAPTGVPKHNLELKIGVPVMVIRNVLHPYLLNGKMFVVSGIERRIIRISEMDRDGNLKRHFVLHRIDFIFEFSEVKFKRRQFPIKLAFAATVHKSQGQTLTKMIIDFRTNFFSPGQVYVGLSRVRTSDDVLLIHKEEDDPVGARTYHPMSAVVKNPVLMEAVRFVENI